MSDNTTNYNSEDDEEEEEEEEGAADMDHIDIPESFFSFPNNLPFGDKRFRHSLFEGSHCLL